MKFTIPDPYPGFGRRQWHEHYVIVSFTDDGYFVVFDTIWRRLVHKEYSDVYGGRCKGWIWEKRAEKPKNLMGY